MAFLVLSGERSTFGVRWTSSPLPVARHHRVARSRGLARFIAGPEDGMQVKGVGPALCSEPPPTCRHPDACSMARWYLIDRWHGEPRNVALEEHDDIGCFAADDLRLLDVADPSYTEILRQASNAGG